MLEISIYTIHIIFIYVAAETITGCIMLALAYSSQIMRSGVRMFELE